MPTGTAKRQGRNDRSQTRMAGSVGGAGSIPDSTFRLCSIGFECVRLPAHCSISQLIHMLLQQ